MLGDTKFPKLNLLINIRILINFQISIRDYLNF